MRRTMGFAAPFVLVVAGGCPARYVSPDAHTGADGESDGAEVIALVDGHGESSGEVSYPDGDRVDWKRVELGRGVAEIDLRGPRKVRFMVYDRDGYLLAKAR